MLRLRIRHWAVCAPLALVASLAWGLPVPEKDRTPLKDLDEAAKNARKDLLSALDARDDTKVMRCLKTLIRAGGRENIEAILKILPNVPETEETVYWDLVQGACSFVDLQAMEHLGETILRLRGTARARDLIFGLTRNTAPTVASALAPILQKGGRDLKLMAAEKLGTILARESVDALIAALKVEEKKTESELRDALVEGLQTLTGKSFGANSVNWEGWWQANREKPLLGPRASDEEEGTGTVVDRLEPKRAKEVKALVKSLERAQKKSVIVISAEYPDRDLNNDNIEKVLASMGIPHEVVKRADFPKHDLKGVGAIVINCAQFHEFCICPDCKPSGVKHNRLYKCSGCNKHKNFSAKFSGSALKKIKGFVARGGYLFSEDWVVKEVIEELYSDYVRTGTVLKTSKVDVVPARGRVSHPFMKGVFTPAKPPERAPENDEPAGGGEGDGGKKKGPTVARKDEPPEGSSGPEIAPELLKIKHRWAIDDESWALKIVDSSKVVTLLTSGKLQRVTGGEGVVALCFRPGAVGANSGETARKRGSGLVMQVLSHFGKQDSQEDEYALQNLLLNFLIAANAARSSDELPEKKAEKKPEKAKEPDEPASPGEDGVDPED